MSSHWFKDAPRDPVTGKVMSKAQAASMTVMAGGPIEAVPIAAPSQQQEMPTAYLRQFKGPDGLLKLQQKWLVGSIPEWRPIKVVSWTEVGIHE